MNMITTEVPVKNNTLATDAFQQIRKLIIRGEIKPGEKLKGEYLKGRLNMGLSPIREALSRLSQTGLVTFNDKIGFSVATMSAATVHDVFETFAKIECLLLAESIANGNDEWEARILAALHLLSKVESDNNKIEYSVWSVRNEEFHDALVSGCNLIGLNKIRNECSEIKNWYIGLGYKESKYTGILTNYNEHKKIAELAIARDTDRAVTKLYTHNISHIESLITQLKNNGYITTNFL